MLGEKDRKFSVSQLECLIPRRDIILEIRCRVDDRGKVNTRRVSMP